MSAPLTPARELWCGVTRPHGPHTYGESSTRHCPGWGEMSRDQRDSECLTHPSGACAGETSCCDLADAPAAERRERWRNAMRELPGAQTTARVPITGAVDTGMTVADAEGNERTQTLLDEITRLHAELADERADSRAVISRLTMERDGFSEENARLRAELAARPTRAEVLREAAKDADDAGGTYASRGQNEHAGAAFGLMEHLYRKANEVEYAATPCSTPNTCDDDEPCDNHERLMGHQVGEHELCGDECAERGESS